MVAHAIAINLPIIAGPEGIKSLSLRFELPVNSIISGLKSMPSAISNCFECTMLWSMDHLIEVQFLMSKETLRPRR